MCGGRSSGACKEASCFPLAPGGDSSPLLLRHLLRQQPGTVSLTRPADLGLERAAVRLWLCLHWAAWGLRDVTPGQSGILGSLGAPEQKQEADLDFAGLIEIPKRLNQNPPLKYFPGSCCCEKWQCLGSLLLRFLAPETLRALLGGGGGEDGHASGGVRHKMEVPGPSGNQSLPLVTHELVTAHQHLLLKDFQISLIHKSNSLGERALGGPRHVPLRTARASQFQHVPAVGEPLLWPVGWGSVQ